VTSLDDRDRQPGEGGGELIPFPGPRARAEDVGALELAETGEHRPPATRQPRQTDTPPGDELVHVGPVLDAELVDDEPGDQVVGPVRRAVQPVVRVVQPIVVVVRHDRTIAVSKAVSRNLVFVVSGAGVLAKRWWDRRTKYERYERQAEIAGDQEAKRYWNEQGQKTAADRHKRRMESPRLYAQRLVITGIAVPAVALLLLLTGLALAIHKGDLGLVLAPLLGTAEAIGWLAATAMWLAGVLAVLAPALAVGVLWWVGRGANAAPAWLHAPRTGAADVNAAITADAIVRALQKLGNAKLTKAFKDDWIPSFELPPTREGTGQFKGYRAIFGLPEGVTPQMVMDAVDVLAANLNRTTMETWPTDYGQEKGGRARHINLYIADRGVMDKPTPAYPLMHEGAADVFEGVPIGITQRGDLVLMPMVGSNAVVGGRPGQGKSNAMRVIFIGAALDPLCEIRIHVFAGNGDFDAYEPRLSRYQKGASKEHAAAATLHLEELLDEVERREYRLAEVGAKKLTRSISQQHDDMRPLLVGFSECHELFGDKDSGELAASLAVQVAKRGRKTGVMLAFDTQSSRKNAIPSELVENMGVNGCFSVKSWRSNDGFLGDGSFAAGIRATELRFNVDRGTMLTTGMTDELFELIRTYFIEVNDDTGWDAATDIIERAMRQLDPQTRTSVARPQPTPVATKRDLLADIAEVLGESPMPAADIPALLARNFPTWAPYRTLTGKKLREVLRQEHGVKVPSTDNRWPVAPQLILDAIARRRAAN
jgi:S-DNA-T family DNA segregation ATPase FtsK/SpoIIIE